ncbi:MAG: hypothetical protein KDD51_09985 [Bdellovibrionales bacterium]|nr:hypothetical protein [Bdellovibrionales bacterium]
MPNVLRTLWILMFLALPVQANQAPSCPDATADEIGVQDPRIRVEGFTRAQLAEPKTADQIREQEIQLAAFLKFLDESLSGESLQKVPRSVLIQPGSWRAPWTVAAEFLGGAPYTVQQYPDTTTLIVRMPWRPISKFKVLTSGVLLDYFLRGWHLDRIERITLRATRRLRDFGRIRERKIEKIREEISVAASAAAEKIGELLKKVQTQSMGTAAIRFDIGGLVQGEATLSGADQANIEGWNSDVLLQVLHLAEAQLRSGAITEQLVTAAEQYPTTSRNVWDWRVSVAPIIVRSQDIGVIHTWGDNAARASTFVRGPENKVWFLHLNLGWVVVDTLDDYDIRVFNQVTIHRGAEMALALSNAIAEVKGLVATTPSTSNDPS